jgi:hypothetical protein
MESLKNSIKAGLSLPKVLVDKDGKETAVPPKNQPKVQVSDSDSDFDFLDSDSDSELDQLTLA